MTSITKPPLDAAAVRLIAVAYFDNREAKAQAVKKNPQKKYTKHGEHSVAIEAYTKRGTIDITEPDFESNVQLVSPKVVRKWVKDNRAKISDKCFKVYDCMIDHLQKLADDPTNAVVMMGHITDKNADKSLKAGTLFHPGSFVTCLVSTSGHCFITVVADCDGEEVSTFDFMDMEKAESKKLTSPKFTQRLDIKGEYAAQLKDAE